MCLYPETAMSLLEFDKVKALLKEHAKTVYARQKAKQLRIHTRKDYIETDNIFRWFDTERKKAFPALAKVILPTYYKKVIIELIDEILDENGTVKDNASAGLQKIRMNLADLVSVEKLEEPQKH